MTEEIIGAINKRLESSNNVVIASHVRPDGDAIGSLLGLGLACHPRTGTWKEAS
jgi:nanoRNase/pAp phosphatase (c-di-AMP/oligoRNAs hydrolase)